MSSPSRSQLPGPLHTPGASLPFKIMGGMAGALILFLLVGFLLPGRWSARRTATLDASLGEIFPYLSSPARWDAWTPWGSVESSLEGPVAGPGARRTWSDPHQGNGALEIVSWRPEREVRYRVDVEGGALRMEGRISLQEVRGGTRVVWVEEGDFGWNPLLGYMALVMERSQGAEMGRSLARLEEILADGHSTP